VTDRAPHLVIEMGAREGALGLFGCNHKNFKMTFELMQYNGYRYLLYKRFDYVWTCEENDEALDEWDGSERWDDSDEWLGWDRGDGRDKHGNFDELDKDEAQEAREELESIIAGYALLEQANLDHWANQPDLIERIRAFLKASFSEYRPTGADQRSSEVIRVFVQQVRGGTVLIVRADSAPVESALLPPSREYGSTIERAEMSASPSRWASPALRDESGFMVPGQRVIESAGEGYNRVPVYADEGKGVAAAEAGFFGAAPVEIAKNGMDVGSLSSIGEATSPLGNAAPFEYLQSAIGDDVMSIAARGVSEAKEASCFSEYEQTMEFCNAMAPAIGGLRGKALCKQNAFDRYQQCRGY
jgi:hypothetical protein